MGKLRKHVKEISTFISCIEDRNTCINISDVNDMLIGCLVYGDNTTMLKKKSKHNKAEIKNKKKCKKEKKGKLENGMVFNRAKY